MNKEQAELLIQAAEALRNGCYYRFEQYTRHSCTDRRHWTYEQECRYGSNEDYELSIKLDALANCIINA